MYASHAPFGGNTVGIEAAAWRYFGGPSNTLSWAEASLLAILPNQPSLLFPGKNNERLKAKRDRLLKQLNEAGDFDALTLELAMAEPLPNKPQKLPMYAPHLLAQAIKDGFGNSTIASTIDRNLQLRVDQILKNHGSILKGNGVHNAAAVVLDIKDGSVLAYVGNIYDDDGEEHGKYVDIIRAPRSTGSLLKPFLYAAMLDEGLMLPNTLLPDVPSTYGQFSPQNFSKTYDGVIGAKMALARSLNMPAVHMLKQYGYPKFYTKLNEIGMSTLTKPPGHYGLTMILGGAEGTLWDMANMYAGTARTLNQYHGRPQQKRYNNKDFQFSSYINPKESGLKTKEVSLKSNGVLSAASIWFAYEAMQEVYRPSEDASWANV